jgi:hypothetical protein
MLDKIKDRLIAALIGFLCGLVMSIPVALLSFKSFNTCQVPDRDWVTFLVCNSTTVAYWFFLAGLPLIGLLLGSEPLLKLLSKLWGTDKQP